MRALMAESDRGRHSERWRKGYEVCCLRNTSSQCFDVRAQPLVQSGEEKRRAK